jgi:hypothetical protein
MDEHKKAFTQDELAALRKLLREKQTADRDRQKTIRNAMRKKYGFWISDFSDNQDGFVESDLDDLISRGTITVLSPTEAMQPPS